MLRTDKIFVKLDVTSKVSFQKIQRILENKLKEVASATKYAIVPDELQIEVLLGKSISLPTVNKILNAFSVEKIKVVSFNWKVKERGRGYFEIVVS